MQPNQRYVLHSRPLNLLCKRYCECCKERDLILVTVSTDALMISHCLGVRGIQREKIVKRIRMQFSAFTYRFVVFSEEYLCELTLFDLFECSS